MPYRFHKIAIGCITFFSVFFLCTSFSHADVETLRQKISEREASIKELEAEIEAYQQEILKTGKDITSLSSAIKNLTATQKKLDANVKMTEAKISASEMRIEELGDGINTKQRQITDNRSAIISAIQELYETDDASLVEIGLANSDYTSAWNDMVSLVEFGDNIRGVVLEQKAIKEKLETTKRTVEDERKKLVTYKKDLADQKKIAVSAQAEKNKLLSQSKSKDATYRKLMNERIAKRDAVDRELLDFESQLRIELDKTALPPTDSGVLHWPLKKHIIAQYFGNTAFSKTAAGLAVYNGQGHNGIDLDADIGTPVYAAQSGIVKGVGDTDVTCQSASFGKWIFIEHYNGLSTTYAHLSLQKVAEGQKVEAGELIGYSGNTGYSTGPHLHFTVYATQGVSISSLKSRVVGCGTYRVPRASLNSYLNPLLYL